MSTKKKIRNSIPEGFVEMGLVLSFHKKEPAIDIIENQVMKMLCRDWNVFYSKKRKMSRWVEFRFYCKSHDEANITYNIGIYMQALLQFHTPKKIKCASHRVPDGFPECLMVELKEKKTKK